MALHFIAKDPNTGGENCPTVWVDSDRERVVVQGWNASVETLAECLNTGHMPDTESVVELPFRMIEILREACDVAERAHLRGAAG
ncbi:hypothetical protein OG909_02650 [Streptomyces sp. NBC_01754]|uniref:hypothetical protein n=1 Tax=Streptomyces sp. NBC_01754 TaxID=2975930 RepID=UPI002DDA6591|nr:hypothetical protein [Streptomyces sp. NBC_01754]WSC91284.1 hypothetical protein OG909_02650 [Streptomyces sp. NBC_01754]